MMDAMVEPRVVVTPEELRQIDAQYQPIPTFAQWQGARPDTAAWTRRLGELDRLRREAEAEALERSVQTAIRAAAFDTGALEHLYRVDRGLTITVAKEEPDWESKVLEQSGEKALDLLGAQVRAYELARELAQDIAHPINEARIRSIHELLTQPQATYEVTLPDGTREQRPFLLKGVYKEDPNHVRLSDGTIHAFAPAGATTHAEMGRLATELQTPEFAEAHPVTQAAYAHYCLVAIHPFCDGNGRVARALASAFTFRGAGVPLLLFADERDAYLDTLAAADRGNTNLFVRLVADAILASIAVVTAQLQAERAPSPSGVLGSVQALLTAHGGLSHLEIDNVASNLLEAFGQALNGVIQEANLTEGRITSSTSNVSGTRDQPPDGFRRGVTRSLGFTVSAQPPTPGHEEAWFEVFISRDINEFELFLLKSPKVRFEERFTLREVHPVISAGAQIRLEALARVVLGEFLAGVADQGAHAFQASDYSPLSSGDDA